MNLRQPKQLFSDRAGMLLSCLLASATNNSLLMYQSYYGLQEMPFYITPDPKFLYLRESPALTGSRLVSYFQGLEPSSIETVPLHGSGETGSDADLRRPAEQPLRLGNIGPGIVHVRRVQRGDLQRGLFPQRGFDQGDDLLERK